VVGLVDQWLRFRNDQEVGLEGGFPGATPTFLSALIFVVLNTLCCAVLCRFTGCAS
jgi:hypothetical protein